MTHTRLFTGWVCTDCMLAHNGYTPEEMGHEPEETSWGLLETGTTVTQGMLEEAHNIDCLDPEECSCEHIDFDTDPCDGCASRLAGDRFAFTFWTEFEPVRR